MLSGLHTSSLQSRLAASFPRPCDDEDDDDGGSHRARARDHLGEDRGGLHGHAQAQETQAQETTRQCLGGVEAGGLVDAMCGSTHDKLCLVRHFLPPFQFAAKHVGGSVILAW